MYAVFLFSIYLLSLLSLLLANSSSSFQFRFGTAGSFSLINPGLLFFFSFLRFSFVVDFLFFFVFPCLSVVRFPFVLPVSFLFFFLFLSVVSCHLLW